MGLNVNVIVNVGPKINIYIAHNHKTSNLLCYRPTLVRSKQKRFQTQLLCFRNYLALNFKIKFLYIP